MHADQLVQRKLDGRSKTRGRQNGAIVEPGLGDTEPRAVFECQLEEVGLRPRIADQRSGRNRARRRPRDRSDGLARHLDLDLVLVQAEEPAGEPVAVGQPDHFGRARLGSHSLPQSGRARIGPLAGEDQPQDAIERNRQLAQCVRLDVQAGFRRRPDRLTLMRQSPRGRSRASGRAQETQTVYSRVSLISRLERQFVCGPFGGRQLDRTRAQRDEPSRDRPSIDQECLENGSDETAAADVAAGPPVPRPANSEIDNAAATERARRPCEHVFRGMASTDTALPLIVEKWASNRWVFGG